MTQGLQEKTVKGVFWAVTEQFGNIFIKFILGIILARLLMPTDFGIVGMVAVFFDIANEISQGGFSQAYIQKKNVDEKDKATAFYFNVFVSIILYAVFWVLAPVIANFYNQPQLLVITRVMALVVIIDAIGMIKISSVIKEVNFRRKTIIITISSILAGSTAIILAYLGFGVWALVWYTLLNKLFLTAGLWIKEKNRIRLSDFSKDSLKSMFSFGSWLLFASIIRKIIENINILVIGRVFAPAQLGFYTKARQLQQLASGNIMQGVSTVAFPVFSIVNQDTNRLTEGIKKFLQQSLLAILPISISLFVVSHPFTVLLLTEKWEPMAQYLQLFCIVGALFPINALNSLILVAQGHSKINLALVVIKNILRISNVILMYRFGVYYLILGEVIIAILSLFINTFYSKRLLKYGLLKQLYDIRLILLGALVAFILSFFLVSLSSNLYIKLILGIGSTVVVFFGFQYLFNRDVLQILFLQIEKLRNKF